jgi:hypothetical protein
MPPLQHESVAPGVLAAPASAPRASLRRAIAKLSFCPAADVRIVVALAAYPDRRHSAILAAWLRAGWRLATGRAVAAPVVAAAPAGAVLPQRPIVRRVFVDAEAEPGLDDFLRGLPRHERGREIRHFIEVALGRARQLQAAARDAAPRYPRPPDHSPDHSPDH